jgi:hypothetical protein
MMMEAPPDCWLHERRTQTRSSERQTTPALVVHNMVARIVSFSSCHVLSWKLGYFDSMIYFDMQIQDLTVTRAKIFAAKFCSSFT